MRHGVAFCCWHESSEHPHLQRSVRFSASQNHAGAERARSRASQMVTAWSSCREDAGEAACHVLTRMLVLTPERRCVRAGMKDQCWRKCWTASFGSCDGFWLLKTNVKAVLD